MFAISGDLCRDFEHSSRLEWLETNHTGAFAMGTVAGVNTRRYHGLLIASLKPPAERYSVLPRVEETVDFLGERFELATAQYPGALHPRGFLLLESFRIGPFPIWRFQAGANVIEKSLCLLDQQQSVLIRYTAQQPCRLQVRLFLSFRDYHALTHRNDAIQPQATILPDRVVLQPYPGLPQLSVSHSPGDFGADPQWSLNHEYLREMDRGLDCREDLFSPGSLFFDLAPGRSAWLIASLEPDSFSSALTDEDVASLLSNEVRRRELGATTRTRKILVRALDQFRITRHDGTPSLIAGYPWFTDWSRDTLISLPALRICSFPEEETKQILRMLAAHRLHGLLPNRFSDRQSSPEYNTADATLWFFVAAHDLTSRTGDRVFLRDTLYPAARDIISWHRNGTAYSIHVDPSDQLLSAGTPETQLTWMDAKVNNVPVTPRDGKPVEINALWYNALRIAAHWAGLLNLPDDRLRFEEQAEHVLSSFRAAFWNSGRDCLFDVIRQTGPDPSIRPNQLFAISLPFKLLDRGHAQLVVNCVREELLTPVGLRTLASGEPAYQPEFRGTAAERDTAYHQGTVWPWLIGPFIAAYLFAYGESEESLSFCRNLLNTFANELSSCCLGSIAEVYDAALPQRPSGCPAQLWSVAQFIIASERIKLRPET